VRLEVLGTLKQNSSDVIENRTRDLLACIIVSQPSTLLRAPPKNELLYGMIWGLLGEQ
jgi:hypothetical protein